MPWPAPRFVVYDIPNENILFFDIIEDEVTDDDLRNNKIVMSWQQAEAIRKAKGLPMPCPPVEVVVDRSLLSDAAETEIDLDDLKPTSRNKKPRGFV